MQTDNIFVFQSTPQLSEGANISTAVSVVVRRRLCSSITTLLSTSTSTNMEQRQKPRIIQDGDNPIAHIYVDGIRYEFTFRDVLPMRHEWLLNVLHSQMNEIHERAYLKGKKEVVNEHRRLLRLPEI